MALVQPAEFPGFAVGHRPVNDSRWLSIELLRRKHCGQALAPATVKIVFLGFDHEHVRRLVVDQAERGTA
jgi:hypothetical protein